MGIIISLSSDGWINPHSCAMFSSISNNHVHACLQTKYCVRNYQEYTHQEYYLNFLRKPTQN